MDIRLVTEDDFNGILSLQLQLEATEAQFDDNLKERCYQTDRGKEKLKNRIGDSNNIFYVAVDKVGKIVGFLDGNIPNDEWWYKDTVAYLQHICVDQKCRKKGIATLLLKKFERTAKERGATYIRLLAFHNNREAISFYKKNDFIEYSTYYNKRLT